MFEFACVYWWTTICHVICLYVLFPSSDVWDIFRIKNNFRFILTPSCFVEGSCLIYGICVRLHMVVSYTYLLSKQHDGCLIRGRNCLLFGNTWVTSGCLVDSMFLIFLSLCCFFIVVFVFFLGGGCFRLASFVLNVASGS